MSSQIRLERSDYYRALEHSQRGDLDITAWLAWFLGCFTRAVDASEATRASVLRKAAFWHRHGEAGLSERQRSMLNRYLDGFEGKLTARKWAAMTKVSIPTAQRDINDLIDRGILLRNPGGSKNTSYALSDE
jgi:Fic family protein